MIRGMHETPHFLAFQGSPRKEASHTHRLLQETLRGIAEAGGSYRLIHLIDLPIRPCLGCYSEDPASCNPRHCTEGQLADAMKGLHQSLLAADGFVLATPVYWFGPTGWVKNFVDRLTALENAGKLLEGKVAGVLACAEEVGAAHTLMHLMAIFNDMGLLMPPYSLVYHIGREPVEQDSEALEYAYRLGRNLVRLHRLAGNRAWWPLDADDL